MNDMARKQSLFSYLTTSKTPNPDYITGPGITSPSYHYDNVAQVGPWLEFQLCCHVTPHKIIMAMI